GGKKTLTVKLGDGAGRGDVDSFDAPVAPQPPTPPGAPRAPPRPHPTRRYNNDGHRRQWGDGNERTDDEDHDPQKEVKMNEEEHDDNMKSFHWQDGRDMHVFTTPMVRSRGRLGVRVDDLSDDMAQALGTSSKGALVTEVLEDTPAQKAGIRAGDVITRVGGDE